MGSRMRCLEPSTARRTLRGCHPFGVPVERGLLAARTSESVLCRQPLRVEQPKRRMAQCCRGEFVETRRWAPALRVLRGAPRLPKPSKAAVARTVERAQAYRSTNKPRRSVRLGAFPSSACQSGPLCRLRSLLHVGSLVSGPTGRLAWQCQKRTHAHVGLVTLHGAKRTQFGLDHCSLRMQLLDLRMQPVSSLRKLRARCNARAGRLWSGLRSDGDGEVSDRDHEEKHGRRCTKRKPDQAPSPQQIQYSAAHRTYRAYNIHVVCARARACVRACSTMAAGLGPVP